MSTSPAEAPQKREGKPRPKGNPPGDLRTVGVVRGVSYAANETRRVRLSQTRWGCLNRRATPQIIKPQGHRNPRKRGKRGDNGGQEKGDSNGGGSKSEYS